MNEEAKETEEINTPRQLFNSYSAAEKIVLISDGIGALAKTKTAPKAVGEWKYRGVEDVEDALRPWLSRVGLAAIPSVLGYNSEIIDTPKGKKILVEVYVEIEFLNLDTTKGAAKDSVVVRSVGQGMDSSDKGFGKAISYATKNCYLAVFHMKGQPDVEAGKDDLGGAAPEPNEYDTGKPIDEMPFGKYKGTKISKLPSEHLAWMLSKWRKRYPDIVMAAEEEIAFRVDTLAQEAKEQEDQANAE